MIRQHKHDLELSIAQHLSRLDYANGRLRHTGTTPHISGTLRADQLGAGAHCHLRRIQHVIEMGMDYQHGIQLINAVPAQHGVNAWLVRCQILRHYRDAGGTAEVGIGDQVGYTIRDQQR